MSPLRHVSGGKGHLSLLWHHTLTSFLQRNGRLGSSTQGDILVDFYFTPISSRIPFATPVCYTQHSSFSNSKTWISHSTPDCGLGQAWACDDTSAYCEIDRTGRDSTGSC